MRGLRRRSYGKKMLARGIMKYLIQLLRDGQLSLTEYVNLRADIHWVESLQVIKESRMSPPPAFLLLSGAGVMLIVAVLFWRCCRQGWWYAVGVGAGAWALGVLLKFAWAIPVNGPIKRGLEHLLGKAAADPFFWLYVGLLTGVFECGMTLIMVLRTRLRRANWSAAVAFGIGFGGMEAFLVGAVSFFSLLATIVFFNVIPADARAKLIGDVWQASGHEISFVVLPIIERVSALFIHCFSCVLIVYGARVLQWRWFWLSFAYKTMVDGIAAWGLLGWQVQQSHTKMLQLEAIFVVLAICGLAGLRAMRPAFSKLEVVPE